MLYNCAHFLRDKVPCVWNLFDVINSTLFSIRYGKRLRSFTFKTPLGNYSVCPISTMSTNTLVEFFHRQPDESYRFFKPHGFDASSIMKLQRNKSILGYVLMDADKIVGYCFIRAFFFGKGFRGRLVDINYRGRGLGVMMNQILNEVGFGIGLKLFETINKENIPSYRSALSASKVKVITEMNNGDLYLQIIPD